MVMGLLASVSSASPTASPFGVYTDLDAFNKAVARSKEASVKTAQAVSPERRAERAKEIERALNTVSPGDLKSMDRAAKQLRVAIYDPNTASGNASVMSGPSNLYTIQRPTKVYDPDNGVIGFNGQVRWNSRTAIAKDAGYWLGEVGGHDGAGLEFTKVTDPYDAYRRNIYTFDYNGVERLYTENSSYQPESSTGRYAEIFADQDNFLGETTRSGVYDWWRMSSWVWFDSSWSDHGNVRMTYSHTWSSSGLSSVDFQVGSDGKSLTGGLTFHFDTKTHTWVTAGYYTAY